MEPLLLSSLELPGLVARPPDPAIEVSTLALHNRNTAKSVVAQAFLLHSGIHYRTTPCATEGLIARS